MRDTVHPMPADVSPHAHRSTLKETLVSIVIAFALAFVFRAFVVEAFVIPTGSMAPTLMGAHMRFRGPETGYVWQVGPWRYAGTGRGETRVALSPQESVRVHDPMTGTDPGDRILVFKYLRGVFDPTRYDVVVFKNPQNPRENYIKRLVGLPGEQVALIDGDVFVRAPRPGDPSGVNAWSLPGWEIARKPRAVQRAVWQPVFDTRCTPLVPERDDRTWFNPPWQGGPGWEMRGRTYRYAGQGPATLRWDAQRWPIVDWYPFNELPAPLPPRFPVSDVRIRAAIQPGSDADAVRITLRTRGHEFAAEIRGGPGGEATISMTPLDRPGEPHPDVLARADAAGVLRAGRITGIEFWHADQELVLRLEGREVARAAYDWSPAERAAHALGASLEDLDESDEPVANPARYARPEIAIEVSGACTVHRLTLDRDLHYQPVGSRTPQQPARAGHPRTALTLSQTQFFGCGDNSPASLDGRLWESVDPWAARLDPTVGVIPASLVIGRAFFVYFPSLHRDERIPVPDFGRMRFIR
jgi:signal peptidase I